jgi:hypothetical protein
MYKNFSKDVADAIESWVLKCPEERDEELISILTNNIEDKLFISVVKGMVKCIREKQKEDNQ